MKTLITIALFLIALPMVNAQPVQVIKTNNGYVTVATAEITDINSTALTNKSNRAIKTTGTNANYLNITNFMDNPEYIRRLESVVAQYNIESSENYDPELTGKNEGYNMAFSTEQSYVEVKYNLQGEILFSKEHFKDIALPSFLVIKIMQDYPDCELLSNTCDVYYKKDSGIQRSYKIKIRDGNAKKTLKLDEKGNLI